MNTQNNLSDFDQTGLTESSGFEIDLLSLASRHWKLLLLGLLVGLVLGELYYRKAGPEYDATARILVEKKVSVQLKDGDAKIYGDRAEHIKLIMSPLIVNIAIENQNLDKLPSLLGEENPAGEILDTLVVKRTAGRDRSFSNVLDLSYRNRYKEDAKTILSAIIEAYQEYLTRNQNKNQKKSLELITQANDELEVKLNKKKEEYQKFRDNAPLYWNAAPGVKGVGSSVTNVHRDRFLKLEEKRRDVVTRQAETKARIIALEKAVAARQSPKKLERMVRIFLSYQTGRGGQSAATQLNPDLVTLESRLVPLVLRERSLLREFGKDHSDIIGIREQINALRDIYRQKGIDISESGITDEGIEEGAVKIDFVALYIQSLKQLLVELKQRKLTFDELIALESKESKKLSRYLMEDQTHSDEIERLKTIWQVAVDQLNRTTLSKNHSGYSMEKMAPVRAELSFKRHLKFLGGGIIGGMLVLFGFIYLRAFLDTTVHTVNDIRDNFNLPILGAIPEFSPIATKELKQIDSHKIAPELYYFHKPGSIEAESFRSVRTALYVIAASDKAQVIQVTSPLSGDGKTTLIGNLAVAMANSGKSVLLIDADMRHRSVHHLFGLRHNIGVSDVLTGEIEFLNAVQQTGFKNLSALTAGEEPENPAELLASPAFKKMLSEAKSQFDFILVDTPPLLAVSDPCIVAPQTDGLLLILRLKKDSRADITRAAELLDTHNIDVLGAIVNGVEVSPDEQTYGNYYSTEHQKETTSNLEKAVVSQS